MIDAQTQMKNIPYEMLPAHMRPGVKRYIEEGSPLGGFLTAVFSDRLIKSFELADDTNRLHMHDWAKFLWNHCPSDCWGSLKKVEAWIDDGGLRGIEARKEKP